MSKRKTNKTQLVKDLLTSGDSITSYQAFLEFGITRLSAIVFNLKNDYNMDIVSEPVKKFDRFGNEVKFSKYYLHGN